MLINNYIYFNNDSMVKNLFFCESGARVREEVQTFIVSF
jgi:hypothetical protein